MAHGIFFSFIQNKIDFISQVWCFLQNYIRCSATTNCENVEMKCLLFFPDIVIAIIHLKRLPLIIILCMYKLFIILNLITYNKIS